MDALLTFFKAAADPSRLRILRLLLAEDRLNVGELVRILGLAQSSVSQKLKELKQAGLVRERREGGFAWYEVVRRPGDGAFEVLVRDLGRAADPLGDLARLAEVKRERAESGAGQDRLAEPGRSWVAWARALGFLIPPLRVADLGCGDGALTAEVARFARAVVAVERDRSRLARARARIARLGMTHVTFRHEDIATTGIRAASVDLALLSQTLHFAAHPLPLLQQAHRLLDRGGRVLVLELGPHREEWVREKLGHRVLGFAPRALDKLLHAAGFTAVAVEPAPRSAARDPFQVLIATGARP